MNILQRIAVCGCLLIALIIYLNYIKYLMFEEANEKESGKRGRVLRFPKFWRALCISLIAVLTVVLLLSLVTKSKSELAEEGLPVLLLWSILSVPLGLIATGLSLWKLEIGKEEVLYRNYFGKTKVYAYKDIFYRPERDKWYLLSGGKKILSVPGAVNDGNLLKRAYTKYKLKTRKEQKTATENQK